VAKIKDTSTEKEREREKEDLPEAMACRRGGEQRDERAL
jgi:hypothetical protein